MRTCENDPELAKKAGLDRPIYELRPYILESFYSVDKESERLIPFYGDFLLDSGAFTFMQNSATVANWEEYIEQYADFINRNKIQKFFELDIDVITGYEKVKQFRTKLEKLTGKQPIPVWHISRGVPEFKRMCDEFPYVALGGIVSGEWKAQHEKLMPQFINEAHKRGAKIHGLGFTKLKLLPHYHFDSVDSTAWTTGNRFGYIYRFDGKSISKVDAPKGHRICKPREAAVVNFIEWAKFQRWAEVNL